MTGVNTRIPWMGHSLAVPRWVKEERERARAKARPGQAKVNSAQSSPADPIPAKQCVERKVAGREKTRKTVGVGNRSETTMREARQETRQG